MKIRSVKFWKEDLELTKPYTIAFETFSSVENLFVFLELENGMIGMGAGAPSPFVTGEQMSDSMALLANRLEAMLCGQDIRHFYSVLDKATQEFSGHPAALAAIDIALYDAFAKYLGIPLVHFWGLKHHRLPTSITIGIMSVEETLAEAAQRIKEGFRVIKLKTGRDVEQDIETFTKLRELVGPGIKIRVDANQGYTVSDLLKFETHTRSLDVEFVEQPFPRGRLTWMQQLPSPLRDHCAADEDLHNAAEALYLVDHSNPFGIFNIKLMKCGGLTNGRRIAQIAVDAGIDLMWGCMDESIISISAALHLALASSATKYIDLDGSIDLARDVVSGGFILEDGYMSVVGKPGLGVETI